MTATVLQLTTTLFVNQHSTIWPTGQIPFGQLAKWLSCVFSTYLYGAFDCMLLSYMYTFQSEFTLYICLNVNGTPTHNHWVWIHSEMRTTTYSQMHRADKYSQHNSITWSVWPNAWVFVYELCGCGFDSRYSHLNYRYRAFFEPGVH